MIMGNNKNPRIKFNCQYCKKESSDKPSHYARKKRHYCSDKCYKKDVKENWTKDQMARWKGGITPYEAHRTYVKKNPERIAHLKARRYAREKNAEGSHTLEEWQELKDRNGNVCVSCKQQKKLTKDHIIPLSKGGSDYITNIQPMCRNCNSRKWNFIYQNPELLK